MYIRTVSEQRPCYRADEYPEVDRRITTTEYQAALEQARHDGLLRLNYKAV